MGSRRQMEAAAQATSLEDLFESTDRRASSCSASTSASRRRLYRGPTVSARELEQLRRIEDVVRLGKVRRIERTTIVLEQGDGPHRPGVSSRALCRQGLNPAPSVSDHLGGSHHPAADPGWPHPIQCALVWIRRGDASRLSRSKTVCVRPNRLPNVPLDWVQGTLIGTNADYLWSKEPDIAAWLERARLNLSRGLRQRAGDPAIRDAMSRFASNVRPGLAKLSQLLADRQAVSSGLTKVNVPRAS
jgi:hypothetical protein